MVEANGSTQASSSAPEKVPTPPLVHLNNTWLSELSARIRARPIPWEGYQRADLVSQPELRMIRAVDAKPRAAVDGVIDAEGPAYARLYLTLLGKLSRTDTLQQVLVLVADMLDGRDDRAALFLHVPESGDAPSSQGSDAWPWAPLVKLLDLSDDFAQVKAATVLTALLVSPATSAATTPPSSVTLRLLSFLAALLNNGAPRNASSGVGGFADGNGTDIAIQLLQALLRNHRLRAVVWKEELRLASQSQEGHADGSIKALASILRQSQAPQSQDSNGTATPSGAVGPQMVYHAVFSIWLLSFDKEIAEDLNAKFGVITLLADVARTAVKEKVVRIVLATFRNLLAKAPDANAPAMLGARCLPLVEALSTRKWTDEEISEDVAAVQEVLAEKLKGMSSYDEYTSELSSGKLSWENPAHELDAFWTENAARLVNEDEGSGLKQLVKILQDDDSEALSLAVACHDIARLVRAHESSKKQIAAAGAKQRIMELTSHPDADVRVHALAAVSRLVSASWR